MLNIQQIFPKLYRCLLYVVFHNLDSSVVVHELELAMNRALYGFVCSLGSQ